MITAHTCAMRHIREGAVGTQMKDTKARLGESRTGERETGFGNRKSSCAGR